MSESVFLTQETSGLAGHTLNAAFDSGAEAGTQYIKFALGDEQYGVDIMAVREIKEWSNVTPLPEQPDYVRGVLDLRGTMVPIVDLRCRFGQGVTETTPRHIVIIVQAGDQLVGLLGDRVLDIVGLDAADIQPVPKVAADAHASFLSGLVSIDGTMIALIDLETLLSARTKF